MSKGMRTCTVCGRDFALTAEDHYVVRGREKLGLAVLASHEEPCLYDAVDCPHCGCQQITNVRERAWLPNSLCGIEEEEENIDE